MAKDQWHYFVGDIHGCYDEYRQIEDKIFRHANKHGVTPFIVSVGDLVDRGPDSAKVVEHFAKGSEAGTHVAVLGNHETFMLTVLWEFAPWDKSLGSLPVGMQTVEQKFEKGLGFARALPWEDYRNFTRCMWTGQGGMEALESFGCDPDEPDSWEIDPDLLSYMLKMPYHWENDDYLVTHATMSNEQFNDYLAFFPRQKGEDEETWELRLEIYQDLCNDLVWQRYIPEEPPDDKRIHLSGHTPVERVKLSHRGMIRQIDTACVYGKRLTAWCGESNTYFRASNSSGHWMG